MKINWNYRLSSMLWLSHFLTDWIAAFALTIISINILDTNSFFIDKYIWLELAWYFVMYNFLAFFWQMFIWYFLDKIENNKNFYDISIKLIITSFIFYISGVIFLNISFFLSILLIWIGSCLFHLWGWNISLLSKKNKATNLWIFASWWVLWLSFWWFIAIFAPYIIIILIIALLLILKYILTNESYEIEDNNETIYYKISKKIKNYIPIIIWLLALILIIRSAIWTNFQIDFIMDKIIIFYIAIVAFLGKIIWWILEDSKKFKERYFIIIWILSFLLIYFYSFYYQNILLLFMWIFWIQIFISPVTIIIFKLTPQDRSKIIWFTFWMSLVFWYLIL